MKLKVYNLLLVFFAIQWSTAQYSLKGRIYDENNIPLEGVEVFLKAKNELIYTDVNGEFKFENINEMNEYVGIRLILDNYLLELFVSLILLAEKMDYYLSSKNNVTDPKAKYNCILQKNIYTLTNLHHIYFWGTIAIILLIIW